MYIMKKLTRLHEAEMTELHHTHMVQMREKYVKQSC